MTDDTRDRDETGGTEDVFWEVGYDGHRHWKGFLAGHHDGGDAFGAGKAEERRRAVIEDEHDEKNLPMLIKSSLNTFEASARIEIGELQKVTNVEFLNSYDNDDVDTLGGLIFSITGRVPQRGEIIKHTSGTTFEIKDADPMKIKSVKVTTPKK